MLFSKIVYITRVLVEATYCVRMSLSEEMELECERTICTFEMSMDDIVV